MLPSRHVRRRDPLPATARARLGSASAPPGDRLLAVTRAWIVVDLGFGDSGKGTLVDFLVRDRGARLVVRWNGGAQAGHGVVTREGKSHVFSQLGSGSFVPGVYTHLAEPVVFHPSALLVENAHLVSLGVRDALDRLSVAESARVITPFHQAANRLRELARGAARHGSCGVGVGETVRDSHEAGPEVVRALHLRSRGRALRDAALRARERMHASVTEEMRALRGRPDADAEIAVLEEREVVDRWLALIAPFSPDHVIEDDAIDGALARETSVLEGAQGVLLDQDVGFHPHTTWSSCLSHAALAWLDDHDHPGGRSTLGVLRTHLTRHGEGPFPTEDPSLSHALTETHNDERGWQGRFRVGWPDLALAKYALAASPVDALAITHLDRLKTPSRAAARYENVESSQLVPGDLAHQERLGIALRSARPVYDDAPSEPNAYLAWLASQLETPIALGSHGPTADDKRWTAP